MKKRDKGIALLLSVIMITLAFITPIYAEVGEDTTIAKEDTVNEGLKETTVTQQVYGDNGLETPISKEIISVTGVMLNQNNISLMVGETQVLEVAVLPEEATNRNVLWETSNPDIVEVSAQGVVTAQSEGQALITVSTEEGSFSDTCVVKVVDNNSFHTMFVAKTGDNHPVSDYALRWRYEHNISEDVENLLMNIYGDSGGIQFSNDHFKEGSYSAYFNGSAMLFSEEPYNLSLLDQNNQLTVSILAKLTEDKNQGIWEFLTFQESDFYLRYRASDNRIIAGFAQEEIQSDSQIELNEWYLFTYIWDGKNLKLYINGNLEVSKKHPLSDSIDINNESWYAHWYIGSAHKTEYSPGIFTGYMDDMIVYGRALTPTEISEMYQYYFPNTNPQKYTITFDTMGGTEILPLTLEKSEAVVIPSTTRTGHNFIGWYIDKDYTTPFDDYGSENPMHKTLYAKWVEKEPLSIQLGEIFSSNEYEYSFPNLTVEGSNVRGIQISFTSAVSPNDRIILPTGHTDFDIPSHLDNGSTIRISNLPQGTTSQQVEAFLREVIFSTDNQNNINKIQIILYDKPIKNVVFYSSDTGHYYEYVKFTGEPKDPDWSWIKAYNEAQSKTFLGQSGYLATVTSEEENNFLYTISNGSTGWFGGTRARLDNINTPNAAIISGRYDSKNFWYWASGPEYDAVQGPRGSVFYDKVRRNDTLSNAEIVYDYSPWSNNEPNNSANNLVYGYEAFLATVDGSSLWNDTPNFYTHHQNRADMNLQYRARGYFVEYGDAGHDTIWQSDSGTAAAEETVHFWRVDYDANGGIGNIDSQSKINGVDLILQGIAPNREGYIFLGWGTSSDATVVSYREGDIYAIDEDITLYALWVDNQYVVSFDVDGGSPVAPQLIDYMGRVTIPVSPTKIGHTFGGWYTDSDFATAFDFDSMPITEDTTIYGKWDMNQYTVTFDSQGGSPVGDVSVNYDNLISAPIAPTKEGYTFGGWYKDALYLNQWNFAADAVTGNITLYAKWSINQYIASFNVDGGSPVASQTIDYMGRVTIPVSPTKIGHTFAGWYTDSDFATAFDFDSMPITEDTTIYGRWDINQYTVTFDSQGGSPVDDVSVNYDNLISAPIAPTKEGYTFGGWYKDALYLNQWNFSTDVVTTDITLYAKWDINEYTVAFDSQGGSPVDSQTINYMGKIIAPVDPTKTGYIFGGWYTDSSLTNQWDFNLDVITVDTTLFARWSQVPSSNSGGGSGGGSGVSAPTPVLAPSAIEVIINGEVEKTGTETIAKVDGKTEVKLVIDSAQMDKRIEDAIKTSKSNNELIIPVMNTGDTVKVALTGDIVKKLEDNDFNVSVREEKVEYRIVAKNFTIEMIAQSMGVNLDNLKSIEVEVSISKLDAKETEKLTANVKSLGHELIFEPVEFTITAKTTAADGTVQERVISRFNNYSERIMEIQTGIDPSKITTGVVFNKDGSYVHVPTEVFEKDGNWYAKINSLTNSTYSVISNPTVVDTVIGHWSENHVNDMASRLVLVDYKNFEANKEVTRAEFADYIVRALGLYREGLSIENKFTDINKSKQFTSILIANDWGIIGGYPNGTFRPDATITREEAMTMYAKAMDIAKIPESKGNKLSTFRDSKEVSSWAAAHVQRTVNADIFKGKGNGILDPKGTLTHAESLTAIRNLLIRAKLIN
ncbi:surface protein [Clostridium aceticum]|uniref:Surface protein n=1 Tax=Clostridium aceticum TaxID=84022 RepID=A0A0D8I8S4_9CLOT|nr:InlB B-repeat-containing protein [Clostridium aceticum]AKL96977.1 surface protein [Clostridium aceticum]KJF25641.1 hypothetical protein TZ02_17490 [Clostridium aceticum]